MRRSKQNFIIMCALLFWFAGFAAPETAHGAISGACVIRDSSTSLPSAGQPDLGTGYAKIHISGINTIAGLQSACTAEIYDSLLSQYCTTNSNPVQLGVVTYQTDGSYSSSGCAASGCDFVSCPVSDIDLGDAPDSTNNHGLTMTAYPAGGPMTVQANFPTVYLAGSPPYGPIHDQPLAVAHLGPAVTLEDEADIGLDQDGSNNIDPPTDSPDQDGADDSLVNFPPNLPHCTPVVFDYLVNIIDPNIDLYVNVWFDWMRNGDFDDSPVCPAGVPADEWAVQNQLLVAGSLMSGLNQITTPQFTPWHPAGVEHQPIWMRITLSEQPWTMAGQATPGSGIGGAGPSDGYQYGETEDYYFLPVCPSCADLNCDGIVNFNDFAIMILQWLQSCE